MKNSMINQASVFVKMIKEICREEEISIGSFSRDFMFRLSKNGKVKYIFGYQFGLNSASAHMICEDKSTTSELLSYAGIPNVEHRCFMSPMNMKYVQADGNWQEMLSMLQQYKTLVLKDNKGTGGLSVYRVRDAAELENAAQILFQSAHSISVSPYYDILKEYRLILLDGNVRLVYHKERKHLTGDGIHTLRELYAEYLVRESGTTIGIPEEDACRILEKGAVYPLNWKHNLGQGASPVFEEDDTVTAELTILAKKAADCIGIRFASVDIVQIPYEQPFARSANYNGLRRTCQGCEAGVTIPYEQPFARSANYNGLRRTCQGCEAGVTIPCREYRILEINSGVMMEYLSQADESCRRRAKEIYREAILKMMEER